MMRFEYNSDCTLEERIDIVKKEIMDDYPSISEGDAKMIAALSSPVEDKVSNDEIFERYYYIMLIIPKDNPAFKSILRESFDIYNDGLKNNRLSSAMEEIIKFVNHERDSFPLLSEFY
jgi:hypothetical protein